MTSYYKETISGLVDEIMHEWSHWWKGESGVHTQVWYDKEDGSMWPETYQAGEWVEFAYMHSYVEIVNITRPDDFPERFDMTRDEVEGAIREGMKSLGI